MGQIESVLKFNKYIVNNIIFKNNKDFEEHKDLTIDLAIKHQVKEDNGRMEVNLITSVFKNAKENNYPFEIEVDITGYFEIKDKDDKIDFKPNAIAILYPYVRAIISNYTVNANVFPVIIPAINVNKLIEEQSKKDN